MTRKQQENGLGRGDQISVAFLPEYRPPRQIFTTAKNEL